MPYIIRTPLLYFLFFLPTLGFGEILNPGFETGTLRNWTPIPLYNTKSISLKTVRTKIFTCRPRRTNSTTAPSIGSHGNYYFSTKHCHTVITRKFPYTANRYRTSQGAIKSKTFTLTKGILKFRIAGGRSRSVGVYLYVHGLSSDDVNPYGLAKRWLAPNTTTMRKISWKINKKWINKKAYIKIVDNSSLPREYISADHFRITKVAPPATSNNGTSSIYQPPTQKITVPDLINDSLQVATEKLAKRGLKIRYKKLPPSIQIIGTKVTWQHPKENEPPANHNTVSVKLAYKVPYVTGLMKIPAIRKLRRHGFRNIIFNTTQTHGQNDLVKYQKPRYPGKFDLRKQIELTITVKNTHQPRPPRGSSPIPWQWIVIISGVVIGTIVLIGIGIVFTRSAKGSSSSQNAEHPGSLRVHIKSDPGAQEIDSDQSIDLGEINIKLTIDPGTQTIDVTGKLVKDEGNHE